MCFFSHFVHVETDPRAAFRDKVYDLQALRKNPQNAFLQPYICFVESVGGLFPPVINVIGGKKQRKDDAYLFPVLQRLGLDLAHPHRLSSSLRLTQEYSS